jgi:hypothetical protein
MDDRDTTRCQDEWKFAEHLDEQGSSVSREFSKDGGK